ncbi:hypothetical protein IAE60_15010 [Pseudoxanthomonas mexicana]|uniref:Tail fiber protein n=1 Tax=Pseudoxanthomonas mexicana TaxID=128785 RepID=A0A7G9TAU3_PSEMX|nr:hypothetical protein [Pseudoxanthomonas mexicana]QNN77218.1 hypothetical protein IAE60_15010 [Pseudoxanthomonas mexicana]
MNRVMRVTLLLLVLPASWATKADPYAICLPAIENAVTTQYHLQSSKAKSAVRDSITQSRDRYDQNKADGSGGVGVDLFEVIGANVSGGSSSSRVTQLSEKYKRDSSLALSTEDFLYTLTTVENPEVAELARDCIRSVGLSQGAFRYTVNDVQTDDFSITYHYVPQASTDPDFLTVTNLTVNGAARVESPLTLTGGTRMDSYAGYTQRFRRTKDDEPALVQLDVHGRPTVPVTIAAKKKFDPLPVGMVVASPLPWGQFAQVSGDSASFDPRRNKWAPCDGRPVAGSALATGGAAETPDLRGVFVRGLNDFAAGNVPPVAADRADPDAGRRAGDFQADELKSHSHELGYHRWGLKNGNGDVNLEASQPRPSASTKPTGGAETRPKNVALYYYVKIN